MKQSCIDKYKLESLVLTHQLFFKNDLWFKLLLTLIPKMKKDRKRRKTYANLKKKKSLDTKINWLYIFIVVVMCWLIKIKT